jgi:diaminopimelate epimerase
MQNSVTATYGHGTHNDFLIIFDEDDQLSISAAQVAAMCNRSTGIGATSSSATKIGATSSSATKIGADGLIRILKSDGKWFMDYRNSDGSIAEMCGNGIRVMARYLVLRGHQREGIFAIDTRAGIKHLRVPAEDDISVNMGKIYDENERVSANANGVTYEGLNINVGNPHAVVFTDDLSTLGSLEVPPTVTPVDSYPEGVNVEFVELMANHEAKMRVHERGSGETQSCGTGTCAVALAATLKSGESLPSRWVIYPPGGRLVVDIDGHSNATLIGPAVLLDDYDVSSYLL